MDTEGVEGFGYAWRVEKLNNELEPVCEIYNPSCWWTHPAPTAFDTYMGSCTTPSCGSSLPGKFHYNRYYRITRGTWTRDCPWRQQSKIFYSMPGRSSESGPIVTVYEVEAPDMSAIMKPQIARAVAKSHSFSVFPNPNNGSEFFLHLEEKVSVEEEVKMTIVNVTGKVVYTQMEVVFPGSTSLKVNGKNNLPAGVYWLTLRRGEKSQTKKMIVQ